MKENYINVEENEKLKAKVTDNEEYTAKLMKGKTQLQERSPFAQKQSIKETRSIGLQFDYLIPSMGKSVIVCVFTWCQVLTQPSKLYLMTQLL